MWDCFGSLMGKLCEWLISVYIRPTFKVIEFNIEEKHEKTKTIRFAALITNNANRAFSIAEKFLLFYNARKEIAKIEVTRYKIDKREGIDKINVCSPIDDIITLQPGETKKVEIFGHNIEADKISKVVFTYYINGKKYSLRLKIPKSDVCQEEINKQTRGIDKQTLYKKINALIKYINDNIGAITWISTAAIAVISTWSKFMWYVYQRGKLFFWEIDSSAISFFDDTTLYSIFLLFLIGIIVIGIMLIPLWIVKSKFKKIYKILLFIIVFIFVGGYFFSLVDIQLYFTEFGIIGILGSLIAFAIFIFGFLLPSFVVGTVIVSDNKKIEKNEKTSMKEVVLLTLLWMIVTAGYSGYVGYNDAKQQNEFRIVENQYAIIYETKDYYYLAEYDVESNLIKKEHQMIIKKDDVEFYIR